MWEATEDPYWLGKISEHFGRIMASASDSDGGGFLSWSTETYSCAVAHAERLHNVSDARIEPAYRKNTRGKAATKCTGHTYLVDFHGGPKQFRILDWSTRELVADDVAYKDGGATTEIVPFRFTISGEPHRGDRFMVRTVAPEPVEFIVRGDSQHGPCAFFPRLPGAGNLSSKIWRGS